VPSETNPAAEKRSVSTSAATALVSLEVVGPPTAIPGAGLRYEIIVKNMGTAPAVRIRVEDVLPAGCQLTQAEPPAEVNKNILTWHLGTLEPGASNRIRVAVQPGETGDCVISPSVAFATQAGLRTHLTRPPLVVALAVPESVHCGQGVPFTIRVTNNSQESMQHVVLRAQIPPGLEFMQGDLVEAELGALAANETKTVHLNAQAVQPGRAVSDVSARNADGLTAHCTAAVMVSEAGLDVRVNAPQNASVAEEFEICIHTANSLNQPARGVALLLALPEGIQPVSATKGGTVDPMDRHLVRWQIDSLARDEHQCLALKARTTAAGDWVCKATVSADGMAESKAAATLHVAAGPTLRVEMGGGNDAIDMGNETNYEVRILNQGARPCSGVRLIAEVPVGLQVVQAAGPSAAVILQSVVEFDPLPQLAGRTEGLYRLRLRGQRPGKWIIQVRVEADTLPRAVLQEAKVQVAEPVKRADLPERRPSASAPPR
jgi:uncharacterized repeat protein (TIGR01451 family)